MINCVLKKAVCAIFAASLASAVSISAISALPECAWAFADGTGGGSAAIGGAVMGPDEVHQHLESCKWKMTYTGNEIGVTTNFGMYVTSDLFTGWTRWSDFYHRLAPGSSGWRQTPTVPSAADPLLVQEMADNNYYTPSKAYDLGFRKFIMDDGDDMGYKVWKVYISGSTLNTYNCARWQGKNDPDKSTNGATLCDVVAIEERETEETEDGTFLIKTSGNGSETALDRTSESNKSIYNDPKPSQYQITFNDAGSSTVTAWYQKIQKDYTVVEKVDDDGNWYIDHYECPKGHSSSTLEDLDEHCYTRVGSMSEKSRTIKYETVIPELVTRLYQPLNLNTNTFATDAFVRTNGFPDWKSGEATYPGNLNASVDNKQGIVNGSAIQNIDMNTSVPFLFKAGSQFGIPDTDIHFKTNIDVWTAAQIASKFPSNKQTTGKISSPAGTGGAALNAQNVTGFVSDQQYGKLRFMYGVDHSNMTSSITIDGLSEMTSDASISYDDSNIAGTGGLFASGKFCRFRSIRSGSYLLTSGLGNSWWMDQYDQNKQYTVGVTVKGTITASPATNSISVPSIISNGTCSTTGNAKINHTAKTNASTVNQPVLWGSFGVGTVRGNVEQ